MSTSFPTALDSFLNPAGLDALANATPGLQHHVQHDNINDAVSAMQAKIGIDGSAATTSLDYLLKNGSSLNPGHTHNASSVSDSDKVDGQHAAAFAPVVHYHYVLSNPNNNNVVIQAFGDYSVGFAGRTPSAGFMFSLSGQMEIISDSVATFAYTVYNAATSCLWIAARARGSEAIPSAVLAGDQFLCLGGWGRHSSGGWATNYSPIIIYRAEENFTATAQGTYMYFGTTPIGDVYAVERMRITAAGLVGIGKTPTTYLLEVNGDIEATSFKLGDGSDKNYTLSIYAAGTPYSITNTMGLLTFGTTSPSFTLNKTGTYAIFARVRVDRANASHVSTHTITLKLRRTNNTAADLANAVTAYVDEAHAALTETEFIASLPRILYTTANTNDVIELWGAIDITTTSGDHVAVEAEIVAIRLY